MKTNTVTLVFVLLLGLIGLITNLDSWSWQSFGIGFFCGLPLATIWLRSHYAAVLLLLLSVGGLVALLFGWLPKGVQPDTVLFNGLFWGFFLGMLPSYHLNKPRSIYLVKNWLEKDGYESLARRLERELRNYRK